MNVALNVFKTTGKWSWTILKFTGKWSIKGIALAFKLIFLIFILTLSVAKLVTQKY